MASPHQSRNNKIVKARAEGQTFQHIAETYRIGEAHVSQILRVEGCCGKTLYVLPGTELLSPIARGLLIRLGHKSCDAVVDDVKNGALHFGCIFGMSRGRFSEIEKWLSSGADLPSRERLRSS